MLLGQGNYALVGLQTDIAHVQMFIGFHVEALRLTTYHTTIKAPIGYLPVLHKTGFVRGTKHLPVVCNQVNADHVP